MLNPGLSEPVVTFRLEGSPDFDVFHLSDRLRMHGWIVPAYTLPPNAEHIAVLRAVVRNDTSRDKIDVLAHHIEVECQYLEGRGMPPTEPEKKTHVQQRRRC